MRVAVVLLGVYTYAWEISNMLDSITTHHGRVLTLVSDVTGHVGAAKPTHCGRV